MRKQILDTVSGEVELRGKRDRIEKFIDFMLPQLGRAAEIPDGFEAFWERARANAFAQLCIGPEISSASGKTLAVR